MKTQKPKKGKKIKEKIKDEPDFIKDSDTKAILLNNDQKYNEFLSKAKEKQKLETRLSKLETSLEKILEILEKK